MRALHFCLSLAMIFPLTLPALAEGQTAAQYAESLYPKGGEPGAGARYTEDIDALFAACRAREAKGGDPCLDYSLFVKGQDYEISGVRATQIGVLGNSASVIVAFKNFGKPTRVVLDLERSPDHEWRVADIRSENRRCASLSGLLRGRRFPC